ncbi:MAG: multicopper oxidase domain-containing protein [Chloroflexota bacterium]
MQSHLDPDTDPTFQPVPESGASTTGAVWRPNPIIRALSTMFGVAGIAVVLLAVVAQWGAGAAFRAPVAAAAPAAVREITLTAQEIDWQLFPGATVKAWAYNGSVPGPEIRVTEGDLVRVTLKNELPVPTTVHWHGVDVPNAMDGVPGLTQDTVPPGGTFTYEFTATNPGTRWYHSHQDAEVQGPLGLYGPLIVEPKVPEPTTYDRDVTYVLSEWALALTPAVAKGEASLPRSGPGAPHAKQLDYDLFLMNGKAHESIPPLAVQQGERVRVRLINAGNLVHTIHTHGHSFKLIATDGNPVPPAAQLTKDSVTLGPSERVDLELVATNPGVWMFHCHMEQHMANGMMTTIRYEGAEPAAGASGHQHDKVAAAPAAAGSAPLPAAQDVPDGATKIVMVDNRFQPGKQAVPVGATVAWVNNGANVHTVSARDGSFDSGAIQAGKAFTYIFTKPGEYHILCRQHLLSGMTATVVVQ